MVEQAHSSLSRCFRNYESMLLSVNKASNYRGREKASEKKTKKDIDEIG